MTLPGWIGRALHVLTAALLAAFLAVATFAAAVMPYRFWDSLAFGSWSKAIAEGQDLWAGVPALYLQRPLFYLEQGFAWRVLGDEEWIGRLLSLTFALILVASVWLAARQLVTDPAGSALLPPLCVSVILASSVVATYAAAGMTDVPVAALVAATGAALLSRHLGNARIAAVAVLALAALLAKPTALVGLVGLVAAAIVLFGRSALRGIAAVAAGVGVGIAYAVWQASRIDESVTGFLTAGNDEFWRERGEAARWDAIARAEWLGEGLRLVVLYGLAHALIRVAGGRSNQALGGAAALAIAWSLAGPILADGSLSYPFDASVPGVAAWLVLAAAMGAAPFAAAEDPISRRTHAALLVWVTPMAIAWGWQRADEVRHLAPVWAPLALVTAAALASLSLALARYRPWATLAPAGAVAILALAALPAVDGLGREGWRGLLELGWNGWTNPAERENYAYGPFSYELNAARENVREGERLVSSNGRLPYFFPGQVEVAYARSCGELEGARFFSFLTSGESLEFAERQGQPIDPLAWLQCVKPPVTLVSEQQGVFAAFVIGGPPARAPAPEECRISGNPGELTDAVFGDGLTYTAARELRDRAFGIGYTGGLRLERTGCSTFRVVVTGIPDDAAVRADFRRQAKRNGFEIGYASGVRYPEVPVDVAAVR